MSDEATVVLFNNCHGRNHPAIYGDGAFYDLETTGTQATKAIGLRPGQTCVVASVDDDRRLTLTWFSLTREALRRDATGSKQRVFLGEALRGLALSKAAAAPEEA